MAVDRSPYQREYRAKNRTTLLAKAAARRTRNRVAIRAANDRYRSSHRAELAARSRDYRRTHRETVNASNRRYRATHLAEALRREQAARDRNPDAFRIRRAAWQRAHPENSVDKQHRRRARVRGALGSHTAKEWFEKVELFGGCCAYCGRSDLPLTRDHRSPLARGGTNYISNIVPACLPCNTRKHDRTETEFLASTTKR